MRGREEWLVVLDSFTKRLNGTGPGLHADAVDFSQNGTVPKELKITKIVQKKLDMRGQFVFITMKLLNLNRVGERMFCSAHRSVLHNKLILLVLRSRECGDDHCCGLPIGGHIGL